MGMIFVRESSKKTKKFSSSKQAQEKKKNAENWEKLLKKYDVKPSKKNNPVRSSKPVIVDIPRSSRDIPSLETGYNGCTKPIVNEKVYSGDAMIGISTLHKSNAIPLFRQEDAVEHGKMRR